MTFKVEPCKKIVWEEGIDHPRHPAVGILKVFAKGKKGFDFHSFKMVFNPVFIPWLRVDDEPMKTTKIFR
jgi:hypothetical protein